MDQETLFTATKWDILSILSHEPKSPIQLAKIANTSVANISQQLRLLEMAGLVGSVRVPNRDRGQPRLVYSLTKNLAFLIVLGKNVAEKGRIDVDDVSLASMRIWQLPNPDAHYYLQKAFWMIEPDLDKIQAILVDMKTGNPEFHIVSDDASVKKKLAILTVQKKGGPAKTVRCQVLTKKEVSTVGKSQHVIYDPTSSFSPKSNKHGEVVS